MVLAILHFQTQRGPQTISWKHAVPSGTLAKQGPGSRQHSCVNSLFPAAWAYRPQGRLQSLHLLRIGLGIQAEEQPVSPGAPIPTCRNLQTYITALSPPPPPASSPLLILQPPKTRWSLVSFNYLPRDLSKSLRRLSFLIGKAKVTVTQTSQGSYVDGRRSFLWKWFIESFTHIHYLYDDRVSLGQLPKRGSKQWKWIPGFCSGDRGARCFPGGPHQEDAKPTIPRHSLGGALGTDPPCGHLLTQYHLQLMCPLLSSPLHTPGHWSMGILVLQRKKLERTCPSDAAELVQQEFEPQLVVLAWRLGNSLRSLPCWLVPQREHPVLGSSPPATSCKLSEGTSWGLTGPCPLLRQHPYPALAFPPGPMSEFGHLR